MKYGRLEKLTVFVGMVLVLTALILILLQNETPLFGVSENSWNDNFLTPSLVLLPTGIALMLIPMFRKRK